MTSNERLRQARETCGVSEQAVADAAGLPVSWYRDLELFADELTDNLSLAHLQVIAGAVGIEPASLLGAEPVSPEDHVSFDDLSRGLRERIQESSRTVADFSTDIGRELAEVVVDPSAFWNFNVAGLRDVCAALGIDWVRALPNAA